MKKLILILLSLLTLLLMGCDNKDEYATRFEMLANDKDVVKGILERRYDYTVSIDDFIIGTDYSTTMATLNSSGLKYQVIVENDTGIVFDRFYKAQYEKEVDAVIEEILSQFNTEFYDAYINHIYFMDGVEINSLQDYLDSGHVVLEMEILSVFDTEELYSIISALNEYNIRYNIVLDIVTGDENIITEETGIDSSQDIKDILTGKFYNNY